VTEPWNGKHAQHSVRDQAEGWNEQQPRSASNRPAVPEDLYDEGRSWLRRGLRRQRSTVLTALVVSWTGVWLAPWGAVLGGLVGMLAAGGIATGWAAEHHLYEIGVGQAVSVVSLSLGLVVGVLAGCVLAVTASATNPVAGVVSVGLGGVLTMLVVVLVATLERPMLRLRGYRRLSRDEARRVAPLVQQVAGAMALDGLPRFAMSDTVLPNAWTHMRTIVLTAGLLQMLEDPELAAVLAHELHHWRKGDAVGLRLLWAAALPTALLLNLGTWIAGSGATQRSPSADRGGEAPRPPARGVLCLIGWAISWAPWIIIKFVLAPMAAATQRRYEYEADEGAASIGLSNALSSALSKIGAFESGRTGWERAIVATHPPTALRIEALETAGEDDAEFHEAEFGRPSFADLMRLVRSAF
jgi:Zn-dependent protease with chaperone function